jgi:hypothetical protein
MGKKVKTRGPRASADDFEEMERILQFFQKVGISASLVVLHCIIS